MAASKVTNLADYKAKKDSENFKRDFKRQEMDDLLWLRIAYVLEKHGTGLKGHRK